MRFKNILSIVAFVAAFGLSTAFAGLFISKEIKSNYSTTNYCKYKQKTVVAAAIENLIAADAANGDALGRKIIAISENAAISSDSVAFADYARAVEDYVDASGKISQDNLPADFKCAWREHLKAWHKSSEFLNKTADISRADSLSADEFDEADNVYGAEIDRTFKDVLMVGRSYGADIH